MVRGGGSRRLFFFQAEDGIRDLIVTGVQTCALPILGYTENGLPKALAALGHEVHVVTSNWNVYGDCSDYDATYRAFLGPADQGTGTFGSDGYTVHRLPSRIVGGYVLIRRLAAKLRELDPAIVHSLEIASFQTFQLAALRPGSGVRLFAEPHQRLSVMP